MFIQLHWVSGNAVYIDPDAIDAMWRWERGRGSAPDSTVIHLNAQHPDTTFEVTETPEEILALIPSEEV